MVTSPAWWIVLGLAVPLFWALPRTWRDGFLAALSFGFLVRIEPLPLVLFLGWAMLAWALAPRARGRRGLTSVLVLLLLGWLALFKYLPPLAAVFAPSSDLATIAVPLGISYFTFKLVHYVLEVSRGNIDSPSPLRYLAWLFLLPTFTAGPIERFDHFQANREDRWSSDALVAGLTRIVHGLIKKFALAEGLLAPRLEAFGETREFIGQLGTASPIEAWTFCLLVFLVVYLDFSAYSDLAIGASRLFGLVIEENFDWPIAATDIGDFWSRWHRTLSGFCKAYVYMPMIGWTRNPYLAVYATFLAIGLWHAGSPSYAVWGLYHATGAVLSQTWRRFRQRRWRRVKFFGGPLWNAVARGLTLAFVVSSFAFTATHHAGGVSAGFRLLGRLVGLGGAP